MHHISHFVKSWICFFLGKIGPVHYFFTFFALLRCTVGSGRKNNRLGRILVSLRKFGRRYGEFWGHSEILGGVTENFGVTQKFWEALRRILASLRKFRRRYGEFWYHSEILGGAGENFGVVQKIWEALRRTLVLFRKFGNRCGNPGIVTEIWESLRRHRSRCENLGVVTEMYFFAWHFSFSKYFVGLGKRGQSRRVKYSFRPDPFFIFFKKFFVLERGCKKNRFLIYYIT